VGAEEAANKARKTGKFDYDAPVEGLKAVDKYTFQVRIKSPMYVFIYKFADCRIACAVAREVVEKYGEDFGGHPVGTGPFRLAFWKRSAKMVLERNPNFREEYWDAEIPPGDPRRRNSRPCAASACRSSTASRSRSSRRRSRAGSRSSTRRWISRSSCPRNSRTWRSRTTSSRRILERRGIRMEQLPTLDVTYVFFNMEDPVFGGYTPEKVALRRAINLSYKIKDEIAILRKGQAIAAETPYAPGVAGYDPNFHTTANEYDPAKAKALLDMFGYVDRDGDG
jgi:ABC-type transport system substrate-binding protein